MDEYNTISQPTEDVVTEHHLDLRTNPSQAGGYDGNHLATRLMAKRIE